MRALASLALTGLFALAGVVMPAIAQERPRIAVTVVTLDALRQLQERYGRAALENLGDERWGRFEWVPPRVEPDLFRACIDDRMGHGLDYCVRFYLTRAQLADDALPTVVVVLDDDQEPGRRGRGGESLRVSCFGRGVVPADAAVQDIWIWPGAERLRGSSALERDREALAACVSTAASERWTGLREPDPLP